MNAETAGMIADVPETVGADEQGVVWREDFLAAQSAWMRMELVSFGAVFAGEPSGDAAHASRAAEPAAAPAPARSAAAGFAEGLQGLAAAAWWLQGAPRRWLFRGVGATAREADRALLVCQREIAALRRHVASIGSRSADG